MTIWLRIDFSVLKSDWFGKYFHSMHYMLDAKHFTYINLFHFITTLYGKLVLQMRKLKDRKVKNLFKIMNQVSGRARTQPWSQGSCSDPMTLCCLSPSLTTSSIWQDSVLNFPKRRSHWRCSFELLSLHFCQRLLVRSIYTNTVEFIFVQYFTTNHAGIQRYWKGIAQSHT